MWFLVVISCKLEVNIERSPSSIYQIVTPSLGGCCYGSWTCTSGSSRRWRKHVLEGFVWQRSLSWFMTFARRRQSKSSDREAVRVSIRESHMSSENRVCGCSGQYQGMQRGYFFHMLTWQSLKSTHFLPKKAVMSVFCIAQRSSLESRWLYILEDSNSTWIFIVSRLQNRKQRWGGIANTKAKWVKWKKKWVVLFHDFRLQQKRSLLWQDRGGQISCRFGRAKDLFFGSFTFVSWLGPERKLKMITQVSTSKTPVMDAFNLRFPTYKSCPTLSCKTSAFQHWGQGLQRMSCQMAWGVKHPPQGPQCDANQTLV